MKQPTLMFYTRNGCPLCDKAQKTILELREELTFNYQEANIDESDELTEKYGLMIPVVEVDGKEVQFGHVDKHLLREALTEKTEF